MEFISGVHNDDGTTDLKCRFTSKELQSFMKWIKNEEIQTSHNKQTILCQHLKHKHYIKDSKWCYKCFDCGKIIEL